MRIWVVEERSDNGAGTLELALRHLAAQPDQGISLLGVGPFGADFAADMRAQLVDVVVVRESAWFDGPWIQELMELGIGIIVAAANTISERLRTLLERYPIVVIPLNSGPDSLAMALVCALAARRRQDHWKTQVNRLQQRLDDRIVIERAKGLLVQRMGICEEEAYNRLRVLSRRQRRQIRDIAKSLIDTQALFNPEENGGIGLAGSASRTVPKKDE